MLINTDLLQNSYFAVSDSLLQFGKTPKSLAPHVENYAGPCYIYDLDIIEERFKKMQTGLQGVEIFYAMKANSNLQILKKLMRLGARIDVVSVGEIKRAFDAGFSPRDVVYSGVGKTVKDLEFAINHQIYQINVESIPELQRIAEVADKLKLKASVALRLNPNISIDTHPYIATGLHENKFGMELSSLSEIRKILRQHSHCLSLKGVSLHLGSQMKEFSGFCEALRILKAEYLSLKKEFPSLDRFDFGGGLGIDYESLNHHQEELYLEEYGKMIRAELLDLGCELQTEPGRWIVARAGVLLAQVQYVKKTPYRTFLIIDSGMNHLIRPALYQAHHHILNLKQTRPQREGLYDVVGPICESADFIAKECQLLECQQDDFILITDVGAYGYTMSNSYNLQDLPEEKFL